MSNFIKKIIFPIAICAAVLIITVTLENSEKAIENDYVLKSYKNTVALYNGENIVTVYGNIVLNTLPEKDIIAFNRGIKISSPENAEILLEDYDN